MFACPEEFKGNAFKEVAIPSPKMIFGRNGYVQLPDGSYKELDDPSMCSDKIKQITDAMRQSEADFIESQMNKKNESEA